jgi:hypothetical protein
MDYNIATILVRKPKIVAEKLQNLFTLYGCIIRSRLGLNRENIDGGIIILELSGDQEQIILFTQELNKLEGIDYKYIKL